MRRSHSSQAALAGEDRHAQPRGTAQRCARAWRPARASATATGLYEGIGGGAADAQGKAAELSRQLDSEKRLTARALAQVEVLNQQIAALRRQLSALESALDASEKDKEAQAASPIWGNG